MRCAITDERRQQTKSSGRAHYAQLRLEGDVFVIDAQDLDNGVVLLVVDRD